MIKQTLPVKPRLLAGLVLLQLLAHAVCAQPEAPVNEPEAIWWGWEFVGRLHPMLVHFPVSLLLIATIMEVLTFRRFHSQLRVGINWLVFIGSTSAIIAAICGWMLAWSGEYGGDTFYAHQWAGTATAVLGAMAGLLLWAMVRKGRMALRKAYQVTLFLSSVGVFLAGHYGGSITHGQDYLLGVTPWAAEDEQLAALGDPSTNVAWQSFAQLDTLDERQEAELNLGVRTVLAHRCFQCHSSDKMEGKLRLDQREFVFQGGESGPIIVPGDVENSELVRRITLPPGHKEAMPGKGKPLDENEINLIKLWVAKGAPWPEHIQGIFPVAPLEPRRPELPAIANGLENPIDRWVNAYFGNNQLTWPDAVDDRVFLRRIYFDLIGLPPTPQELREFQEDRHPDKRAQVAAELLGRNADYALHWTTFWNDLLRNDYTGPGYITNGRFNISDWLYRSLADNKPYDQFVKELLNPDESSKGFIKGIAWRGAVNSSQTTAMQAAQNVSQALLGVNLKCASCHDSFVSDWKLDDAYAFANIFSDTTLAIARCDIPTGQMADTRLLWPELGNITKNGSVKEKSRELATLLTQPENGRLYRTLVNRIWAQLMGRGIVAPTDEMDNEPWSQDLLDWLAVHFVDNAYDVKHLLYLITTSETYQLPSVAIADPATINKPDFVFTGALKRKLTAEQYADAVSTIVHPLYPTASLMYNPEGDTTSFEESHSFVRAALVQNDPFLTALGRPSRENIISVRDGQATLLQAMELTNGSLLNETLIKGAQEWMATHRDADGLITAVFMQSVGRMPSEDERDVSRKILGEKMDATSVQDLLWSVVLLPEFQFIE
ncbi:DUF1549 domain-containing protein [Parapedobacter sp. 10938]|uniref:DUF1549 domain-containing protein n=1 Tax=Parapedobacter flavus TaxID=3110225 RepID=UPI002DBA2291|nr:DUF1549 domain-containing protein [Parapedobacter sp. 10938]MEC3879632.1 DUF1549 domain-containing protein [Parapedobacter sp. 10938]